MRIDNRFLIGVHPYRQYSGIPQGKTGQPGRRDRVEISEAAKELQQRSTWAAEREEKVRRLKEQIDNRTYEIDARAIAEKLYKFYKGDGQ
ncbi:flagellar biosynthesis anti-sigma factor FlgM [Geobacillus sp. FSL K6-0789]|uniref:Negative regulator of flagellin synthesis n=1 Tax=Geobacillus stearothermophilus TaxID=1422 RepID=A0A3L7CP98_GEOSE|nr:flagellar biosynthesis anti-sigma factor FlgM [Geobacillus stearothermophilus]RLQ05863.1 flagellar biosynthesis anti-sigma factor FlgM [Geobacillus stearothermophilus]RLQ06833.1 flagellar biosynthesis anti-sigma factor FlgM [Geobacillus stearothermophilus]RLQ13059.1 flagellar biosynthesis anti-sigma factor FlgM [Geobacillus stearothermophilus]